MRCGVALVILIVAGAVAPAAAYADGATTSTSTTAPPQYAPLVASSLPKFCVGAGTAAIVDPGRPTVTLGTPAAALGPSQYAQTQPLVAIDSAAASGSTCRDANVTLTNLSLFDGVVTASSVQATDGSGEVSGLEVDGAPVTTTAGSTTAVGDWAELYVGWRLGRLSAPLALRVLQAHDSLSAGDTLFVAFSASAAPRPLAKEKPAQHSSHVATRHAAAPSKSAPSRRHAKNHHRKARVPQPLKWTPRLGFKTGHYVFPVDGGASYVDTYGANRSDIYDGWHHGDDLFAPLGTPVVAVRRGTLSLVGWNELGGWRLWLTDAKGNSFYYAHLAGYSRWILHHRHVRAGQVIGFLGRTGDAFTTTPHLHFEIHPHQLLGLGYDGAVDPTTYLQNWQVVHVPQDELPRPARLRAPLGTPAEEAAVVWRELLVARHLLPHKRASATAFAHVRRPSPPPPQLTGDPAPTRSVAAVRTAARVPLPTGAGPWPFLVLALTLLASVVGGFAVERRRGAPTGS